MKGFAFIDSPHQEAGTVRANGEAVSGLNFGHLMCESPYNCVGYNVAIQFWRGLCAEGSINVFQMGSKQIIEFLIISGVLILAKPRESTP